MYSNRRHEGEQSFMKYIFFMLAIIALKAADNAEADKSRADQCTEALNKQLAVTSSAGDSLVPSNHFKILILLQRLESILKKKKDVVLPEFSPDRPLKSGDKDESILILRQILQSLGYLEKATNSPFFDMELEKAVKAFQAGHCIEDDGVIGEATKIKLNWGFTKRLAMIADSISKIKNLVMTSRLIIVNIPT